MMTKRMGPPPLVIPQRLIDHLEQSYEHGPSFHLEIQRDSPDAKEFINASKLYAKRVNKSFRFHWDDDNLLKYFLSDKRPYTSRTGLNREK